MIRFNEITQIMLLLAVTGCSRPPMCSSEDACNDVVSDGEEAPLPDLPCGGADLMTDAANCGACGNACDVSWSDSPYGPSQCLDGECGPTFEQCILLSEGDTCSDLCQLSGGDICVARGCPGVQNERVTALRYHPGTFGECLPEPPNEEFAQDCDEPIPYDPNFDSRVSCCCL